MVTTTEPPSPAVKLTGHLSTASIVLMVVAAAAPLTVVVGSGTAMALSNGGAAPVNYLLAGGILLLFSVGFTAMSHHVKEAGAFFSFVGSGLGRHAAVGTAYLALLTYVTLLISLHAYLGFFLSSTLAEFGVSGVPWWACALCVLVLSGFLGSRKLKSSSRLLGVLLILEVSVVLLLSVVIFIRGGSANEGVSAAPFDPELIFSGSLALGVMFAFSGYTGFEATAVFRDEARRPKVTIPRATYIAVISIGVFYAFTMYAIVTAWGPFAIQAEALKHVATGDLLFVTAQNYVGSWLSDLMGLLILTSLLACVLSFQNVLARYLHTLGRNGLLPRRMARVHPRTGSPAAASWTVAAIVALFVLVAAAMRLDPVSQVIVQVGSIGSLGITVLFTLSSVAVVVFYRRHRVDTRVWNTLIAPSLAVIGLGAVMIIAITNFDSLTGTSSLAYNYALASIPFVALLVGIVSAEITRRKRPRTWNSLDFGIRDQDPSHE